MPSTRLIARVAAVAAFVGIAASACGGGGNEAPTTTTTTTPTTTTTTSPAPTSAPAEPSEKNINPTGGNLFTPTVVAPPAPTEPPGVHRNN